MDLFINIGFILASIVLLYFGAEWMVKGSSNLALRLGMQPIIVGLTIVAFGTSAPELIVSVDAAIAKQSGLSIGNVVGSNYFNILVILGLTAILHPVLVDKRLLKSDIPLMILATGVFVFLFWDGRLEAWEGMVLITGMGAYIVSTIYFGRRSVKKNKIQLPEIPKKGNIYIDLGLLVLGLLVMIGGSRLLVIGGVKIAKFYEVSDAIIGLTIVSVGTSLPELATSIMAAFRGKPELAIGNAVGSNMFNILGIAGTSAMINPISGTDIAGLEFVFLGISALILWPLAFTGRRLIKWEGILLLLIYVAYMYLRWPR
jgi:cation:H+ antiporter